MSERAGEKVHITQAVIDGSGVIAYHRKTSLAPGKRNSGTRETTPTYSK